MSDTCPNCGSKVYSGACVNCHEETYIYQQHLEEPSCELSDEFIKLVATQQAEILRRQEERMKSSHNERNT